MEKPFSKQLKEYQDKHGLTNEELATKMEISSRMVKYYLDGQYDGSPKKVKKYWEKLSGKSGDKNENVPQLAQKYILLLEEKVRALEETIKLKDEQIKQLSR